MLILLALMGLANAAALYAFLHLAAGLLVTHTRAPLGRDRRIRQRGKNDF